ncbi:MAG: hypothetical protein H6716_17490 [Polyangiaceae bacterium]|nr:hypothetical protein [Polyangiaceae bacterium]
MRGSSSAKFGAVLVAGWMFACGNADRDRAPFTDGSCDTPGCNGSGSSNGGSGNGGGAGSAGTAGVGDTLSGDSFILDETITGTQGYSGVVHVTAEADGGGYAETDSDELGHYELSGVSQLPGWIAAEATNEVDLLPTWQPFDAATQPTQDLLMMRQSTLDLLIASANTTVIADASRGHVLVHVVEATSGASKVGVKLAINPGAELVLFDDGAGFSSNVDSTGSRGFMLLVNIPVNAHPGQGVTFTVDDSGQTVPVETHTARGAIGIFDLAL